MDSLPSFLSSIGFQFKFINYFVRWFLNILSFPLQKKLFRFMTTLQLLSFEKVEFNGASQQINIPVKPTLKICH
jgi:hypothetical protein